MRIRTHPLLVAAAAVLLASAAAALWLAAPSPAIDDPDEKPAPLGLVGVGPLDVTGEIEGAPFRIIVPTNWNGKLIVVARGYRDKADHPGEVDDRDPLEGGLTTTRTMLLDRGWALAGTAYKDNGWAVKEALEDLVALASYFNDAIANPVRTYLLGASLGSVPTLELAERNAGVFDGYLATCSIGVGAPRFADWHLAAMLAYDVAFGEPAAWGRPGDVRDDLDFESEVRPVLLSQISDPASRGKFEFIRLVAGMPGRGLVLPDSQYPGWVMQDFRNATENAAELERRAGGPVMQNLTHTYSLTPAEEAGLASLGVNSEPLLAAMNARRTITASPSARNYVEHYAEFTGLIKKPVLTLHTEIDSLVPVSHESAYAQTVAGAGRSDLLFQAHTTGVGHCNFSAAQRVAAVTELDGWVESGVRPTASDFPASLGFDQSFVPPAWLQP